MKDMTVVEWLIGGVIVLILCALIFGSAASSGGFREACSEANGKVVSDGRQLQCIKGKSNE